MDMLSTGVKNTNHLVKLDLAHNRISEKGAKCVMRCLENNKGTDHIDFSYNKLGRIGGDLLAKHIVAPSCQ